MIQPRYYVDLTTQDRRFQAGEDELTFIKIGKPSRKVSTLSLQAASILADSICQHMNKGAGHTLFFIPDNVIALAIVAKVINDMSIPTFVIIAHENTDSGDLLDLSNFFTKGGDEHLVPISFTARPIGTDELVTVRKKSHTE